MQRLIIQNIKQPTACPTKVSASSGVSIFAFVPNFALYFGLSIFASPAVTKVVWRIDGMAIEKVKEYFKTYNMADRIQEFTVSSA